jgi:hypothetical protein
MGILFPSSVILPGPIATITREVTTDFGVYKIKVGTPDDRKILEGIRAVTSKPLRVDANEGWTSKEQTLEMINWMAGLGVELVEMPEFNCCGLPLGPVSHEMMLILAARNLALAEREGLNILTLCPGCAGTLKKVNKMLKEDKALREDINNHLKEAGLEFKGTIEAKHNNASPNRRHRLRKNKKRGCETA